MWESPYLNASVNLKLLSNIIYHKNENITKRKHRAVVVGFF